MKPQDMPLEVWEALCTHCGKCCTEKIDLDGTIYISKKYCRFFDKTEMRCSVYENRFQVEPGCSDVPKGVKMGIFPADCPYIEGVKNYKPALEEWDDPAVTEAIQELLGDDAV